MDIKKQEVEKAAQILLGKALPSPKAPDLAGFVSKTLQQAQEENTRSALVMIRYKSLNGNLKTREILIRKILKNQSDLYIQGVAMDIKAPRLIKVANIQEITDPVTKRKYTDPYQFLKTKLGIKIEEEAMTTPKENDFSRAVNSVGNEITVLMYLVAIDGRRRKEERAIVLEYVKNRTPNLAYDEKEMDEYLISVAPDAESFKNALMGALNQDRDSLDAFMTAVLKIITADDHIHEKERHFLTYLVQLLAQKGVLVKLPLRS
ncbi:MAG: TerB family tellurite resistance protein [Lactobacillales bacterium]|jgi:uncharacterized tellurite resistance protein B-like protein|nr:TerB family tellurite resistance protein [Lactobacillales bacterium]